MKEPTDISATGRAALRAASAATKAAGAAVRAATDELEEEEGPKPGSRPDKDVEEALDEIPESAVVDVYRILPDRPKGSWCMQLEAKDFTVSEVGRRAGPGHYRCLFKTPSKLPGRKFDCAGSRFLDVDDTVKMNAAPAPAATAAAPGAELGTLMERFTEMMARQMTAGLEAQQRTSDMQTALVTKMAELAKATPTPGESPMERLLEKLLPVFLAKPEPAKDQLGVRDVLELMKEFREKPGGGELGTALGLIGKMKEMFAGDSDAPPWLGAVEKGISVIESAMSRRAPAPAMPTETAPALTPGAPAPAPASAAPAASEAPSVTHPLLKQVGPYMPELIRKAEADSDPDLWAGVMLEGIPRGYHTNVHGLLIEPGLLELILTTYPAAAPFREWFAEFLEAAKERTEPEPAA